MTTDQVYRRAMSRERAIAELFACAGTQFDPELVERFCALLTTDQAKLTTDLSHRWLNELSADQSNALWNCHSASGLAWQQQATVDALFHQKLLDSMHDGVVFIDTNLQILLWNRAAERLTAISAASVLHRLWAPQIIGLRDENGSPLERNNCPIAHTLNCKAQTLRRLTMEGRGGERMSVDAQLVPVMGRDGIMLGATLLLHDASSQITLEERVQTLHIKATRDPLTRVANRAEFDRLHTEFVDTHLDSGLPCALIICDIDHFKNVNDTYGHQAGDEVLVSFAALLQRSARPGDLVARYGGEEFVMLCADCDNATITQRAEKIRRDLQDTPQGCLDSRPITASFGVTEIQAGDTPETMLRRADRALLRAKESGRNRVVQLGTGIPGEMKRGRRQPLSPLVPTDAVESSARRDAGHRGAAPRHDGEAAWFHLRSSRRDHVDRGRQIAATDHETVASHTPRCGPTGLFYRFAAVRREAGQGPRSGTARQEPHHDPRLDPAGKQPRPAAGQCLRASPSTVRQPQIVFHGPNVRRPF